MKGDMSGNSFMLKEFPDWNEFDHNHSGVKKMIMFQPEEWINSLFDDTTEKRSSKSPKEKQPSTIYSIKIKGKIDKNSFQFDDDSEFNRGKWING